MRNLIFILSAIILLAGCTKEGLDGIDGKDGIDGVDGIDGADGNANVVNYDITITPSQWSYDDLYETWYYQWSCNANSNSLVYGYVMSGNGEQAMPYLIETSYKMEQFGFAKVLWETPPYIEFQYVNFRHPDLA